MIIRRRYLLAGPAPDREDLKQGGRPVLIIQMKWKQIQFHCDHCGDHVADAQGEASNACRT